MTEMTVAEFMANPPNLDDLLKQVHAGDPDAVGLVKAIFAMEKSNAIIAKWASDKQWELKHLVTLWELRGKERLKRSRAQQASADQRRHNAERCLEEVANAIAEIVAADPELKFGQRGIRETLKQRLKEKGLPLTDKRLSRAITLARGK